MPEMSETERERRRKIAEASKRRWADPEYKTRTARAIQEAQLRNGVLLSENSMRMWENPEHRRARSAETKAKWQEPGYRERLSESHRERWRQNGEMRQRYSDRMNEHWADPENRAHIAEMSRKAQATPEVHDKHSRAMRRIWADPERREKIVKSNLQVRYISPNRLEQRYIDLLEAEFPGQWLFTGSGRHTNVVAGKCPDFVHVSDRKLIEIFGNYWHSAEDEPERIAHFEKHGYRTLVIWQTDNPAEAVQRVRQFLNL